jgi:hypothetical protein
MKPQSFTVLLTAVLILAAATGLQALVDRFRSEPGGRTVVGSLPVHVTFPAFGSTIFLASELTAEGRAPSVDLTFKRTRN